MATVTTGSDFREWNIDPGVYTKEEMLAYIESLEFNPDDIRYITMVLPDKTIAINGYAMMAKFFEGCITEYDSITSAYTTFDGTPVHAFNYYSDKQKVSIEFAHHPMEVKRPNKTVELAEFGTMFQEILTLYKEKITVEFQGQIDAEKDLPEDTGGSLYYTS